jgi:hypothetical protein
VLSSFDRPVHLNATMGYGSPHLQREITAERFAALRELVQETLGDRDALFEKEQSVGRECLGGRLESRLEGGFGSQLAGDDDRLVNGAVVRQSRI